MEIELKINIPLNILVQRRAAIGDVIMSTGVVRELKKRYGNNANIDIATDYGEVYRNNPHIRNVFPVDQVPPANNRYDLYINLDDAYENNPDNHYIDNFFYRAFGSTEFDRSVELFPTDDDKALVDKDIAEIDSPYIVVHLRNWNWQAKNISMDVWFDVFAKLFETRTDFKVVCVGGGQDQFVDHPLFVDLRGKYTNQQLKHLCDRARCFVGIDSGPYWCAAASDTTTIALLTHLLPERIVPFVERAHWIQTLEDCAGCNDHQARPVRQVVCKKTDYPCVNNFDTANIALKILGTL
jgi:ADP-heptose:LPS heptosyltransferase